ncbi:MAG: Gfo/Idh/MocA family oxidoreductase [Rhodospirillaceae bacterium]|nr:Gfo/Idh/MocA family oxidoreductase [Rhodospirillaceae bacterium]MBT4589781.1 Gfo/Idh/MocA family oxidoreductase [Rhodospirillaceae bacterium]MBT4937711.1 Gfo/Idh/MocA family oxidoreductase [Rhodospirillaceae bacterium]MBT5939992.1 Gfo/Idh/MocA family oxidoreductase [Rhodospirillaceae bacterium]MBT7266257.1 Gfo/Idh/MocA family oxidoreductase [Rhodospirillaceae bacterium]
MLNTAIVGLGWWGRHIVTTLQGKSDKIRFSRAVDIAPESTADIAEAAGLTVSADLADVLNDADIEAVVLATPHSLHEEQIIAAAKAGKHVFCEKPLALTLASAERSVEACDAAGVVLGLGHERRFEPAMQEIAKLVASGELGEIMHVESNFSHDKLANLDASNWRVSSTESPAAAMTATGIHITDAYANMFGPVAQVFALTATRNPANANGDILNFSVRFKSGATGAFNSILETPLYMRYAVFGSKAWVEARDYSHPSEEGPTDLFISRTEGEIETQTFQYVDTVKLNFEAWADAIAGIQDYPFTKAQKLENIAVFEAICQSAEKGLPINL